MTSEPNEDPRRFPATRWSMVAGVQSVNEDHRLHALENFLRCYYEPLKICLRFQFHLPDDEAGDYLHEFILSRVIRKNLIALADRNQGKLRTFLVRSLNHFVIDELRKQKAAKRNPDQPIASLEDLTDESLQHLHQDAQCRFDLEFARNVVHQALRRMRQRCEDTNRDDLWRVLHERVLGNALEGSEPVPYHELTALLGVDTTAQAANLLTSSKRMFARVFKSVVKDYESDEDALENEVRELRNILSNA